MKFDDYLLANYPRLSFLWVNQPWWFQWDKWGAMSTSNWGELTHLNDSWVVHHQVVIITHDVLLRSVPFPVKTACAAIPHPWSQQRNLCIDPPQKTMAFGCVGWRFIWRFICPANGGIFVREILGIYLVEMVERSGRASAGKMRTTMVIQPVFWKMKGYPKGLH